MNYYIVGSSWHLIVAAAIELKFKSKGLFLLERTSENSIIGMVGTCEKLGLNYVVIGDIEKTRFNGLKIGKLISFSREMKSELNRVSIAFDEFCRKSEPGTIYYFNAFSPITRVILRMSVKRNYILNRVEDGICDYFDFPFIYYPKWQRIMKFFLAHIIGVGFESGRAIRLIEKHTGAYFAFFPEKISNWSGTLQDLTVFKSDIRKVVSSLASRIDLSDYDTLVIGQTLFEDKFCSLDEELAIYEEALSSGASVLFKPHPRSSVEKLDKLQAISNIEIYNGGCSVEEMLVVGRFSAVVGMWSNPVVYSQRLFDVKSMTLINRVKGASKHFTKVKDTVNRLFSDQLNEF